MIPGSLIAQTLAGLGTTHVVWIPDSTLGDWEQALETSDSIDLLRVCREGEAWPLAAGLQIGGQSPLVIVQITGLFESGDAMRNVLFDLRIPLFAIVGYRSFLIENSRDTAKQFTEPILNAWGIPYVLIQSADDVPNLVSHYQSCQAASTPGFALIAEGKM